MSEERNEPIANKASFSKLLATGLFGWAAGSVLLVAAAFPIIHPEALSIAALWAVSHWWVAFAIGAVALVLHGVISRKAIGTALMAYLLPVGILSVVCGVFLAIYPESTFRGDLLGYLSLILFFQAIGLAWVALARDPDGNSRFARAVIPAVIGGLTIISLISFPVFTGNPFIYRNAFSLAISKATLSNGAMLADGLLEIKKPGKYAFTAPRYVYPDGASPDDELTVEMGKITWGTAGPPAEGAAGSYPFQIRWEKNVPVNASDFQMLMGMDDQISLEVRDPSNSSQEVIYNLSAPIPGSRQ